MLPLLVTLLELPLPVVPPEPWVPLHSSGMRSTPWMPLSVPPSDPSPPEHWAVSSASEQAAQSTSWLVGSHWAPKENEQLVFDPNLMPLMEQSLPQAQAFSQSLPRAPWQLSLPQPGAAKPIEVTIAMRAG